MQGWDQADNLGPSRRHGVSSWVLLYFSFSFCIDILHSNHFWRKPPHPPTMVPGGPLCCPQVVLARGWWGEIKAGAVVATAPGLRPRAQVLDA